MLYLTAQSARLATLVLAAALAGCATPGAAKKAPAAFNGTRAMATPPVLPQPQGPVPLREPALVMRVWVAPWEGANGDLNVPGYVYTEIAPRRWTTNSLPVVLPLPLSPCVIQRQGGSGSVKR